MANIINFAIEIAGPQIILLGKGEVRFSVVSKLRLEYRNATEDELESSIFAPDPNDPEDETPRKTLTVWVDDTPYVYAGVPVFYAQPAYELLVQYVR